MAEKVFDMLEEIEKDIQKVKGMMIMLEDKVLDLMLQVMEE